MICFSYLNPIQIFLIKKEGYIKLWHEAFIIYNTRLIFILGIKTTQIFYIK